MKGIFITLLLLCSFSIIKAQEPCQANFGAYQTNYDSLEVYFGNYSIPYPFIPPIDTVQGDSIITSIWDLGDGTILSNPGADNYGQFYYKYSNSDTYNVTLTITTEAGCSSTFTQPLTVYNADDCAPGFYGYQSNSYTYEFSGYSFVGNDQSTITWDFGDGATGDGWGVSHTYADFGTYNVTMTLTQENCTSSVTQAMELVYVPTSCYAYYNWSAITPYQTPRNIQFTNYSYTSDLLVAPTYFWDFGDGATSTEANPIHEYPQYGAYTTSVTMTVNECTQTYSSLINIDTLIYYPNCQIGFTYANDQYNYNIINFSDYSIAEDSILQYKWDFGDGSVGYGKNVSHLYELTDMNPFPFYDVTLTITSAACGELSYTNIIFFNTFNTDSCYNSISSQPIYDQTVYVYGQAYYDATASEWIWDFGDGTIDNTSGANAVHTYEEGGDYQLSLTTISNTGCTYTTTWEIFIFDSTKCFSSFYPVVNQGAIVTFNTAYTYTPSGQATYLWDFGDGTTSTEQFPMHEYFTEGWFDISFTVNDPVSGCSYTYTDIAYIDEWNLWKCNASAGAYPTGSTPLEMAFYGYAFSIDPNYTITWNFGDGTIAQNLEEAVHTYPAEGVYNVDYIVSSASCQDTFSFEVYAGEYYYSDNLNCQPTFYTWEDPNTNMVQFYAYGIYGSNWWAIPGIDPTVLPSILWDFGDGNTSTEEYPIHFYQDSGAYFVTLTVTSADCVAADSGWVYVGDGNNGFIYNDCYATFTYLQSSNDPLTFTFFNQSAGENVSSSWNFGNDDNSTETNPTYTFPSAGIYVVSLNNTTTSGCSDNNFMILQVAPNITYPQNCQATFEANMSGTSVAFIDNSLVPSGDQITSWLWEFGDETNSTEQNPIHNYSIAGNYLVKLTITTALGCSSTYYSTAMLMANTMSPGQNLFVLNVATEDNADIKPETVTVAPNPMVNDIVVTIENIQTATSANISMFNIEGKLVQNIQQNMSAGTNSITLQNWAERLATGVYLLRIQTDNAIVTKRLVK